MTNDTSSAFYGNAINVSKYDIWAVGALIGYDFGPAQLDVWALDEVSNTVSTTTTPTRGDDPSGLLCLRVVELTALGAGSAASDPEEPPDL